MKSMVNSLINEKSINQKVTMLLQISKNKNVDKNIIEQVVLLTKEHSDHLRLGKVFGYSVSDYAFATLKWLNTDDSLEIFDELFSRLSNDRKNTIEELIKIEAYNQI